MKNITLMKGDKVIEIEQELANAPLFFRAWRDRKLSF